MPAAVLLVTGECYRVRISEDIGLRSNTPLCEQRQLKE
jgi:hypothetical protein